MNFLTSLFRGGKPVENKHRDSDPIPLPERAPGPSKAQETRFYAEPHTVSDPSIPEAQAYSQQYWDNRARVLPFKPQKSYGGVVINNQGQVLLREPAGHFDGYVYTWAKGSPNPGESPQQTALREVLEETGYRCEIIQAEPLGEFYNNVGSKSVFYLMKPIEQVATPDDETASVAWVSYEEAKKLISQTTKPLGRLRDLTILEYAYRGRV
jgi:8-oxo-dGTP pyrophosphatase MutT (NUDIX family)